MNDTDAVTRFGADPNTADWYYCAVIERFGETDYVDGYATGERPTRTALQDYSRCLHQWEAGMMIVDDEDAESVAATRPVNCGKCDRSYADRDKNPLKIIEFKSEAIKR